MFCSHYKQQVNNLLSRTSFLFFLLMLIISLVYVEYTYMTGTMTFVNYLQKIIMSLFFLGLLVHVGSRLEFKVIHIIADTSFGVFFIHAYILTMGKMISINILGDKISGNILYYTLTSLIILALCVLIIVILQKIMGSKSRYLVGS